MLEETNTTASDSIPAASLSVRKPLGLSSPLGGNSLQPKSLFPDSDDRYAQSFINWNSLSAPDYRSMRSPNSSQTPSAKSSFSQPLQTFSTQRSSQPDVSSENSSSENSSSESIFFKNSFSESSFSETSFSENSFPKSDFQENSYFEKTSPQGSYHEGSAPRTSGVPIANSSAQASVNLPPSSRPTTSRAYPVVQAKKLSNPFIRKSATAESVACHTRTGNITANYTAASDTENTTVESPAAESPAAKSNLTDTPSIESIRTTPPEVTSRQSISSPLVQQLKAATPPSSSHSHSLPQPINLASLDTHEPNSNQHSYSEQESFSTQESLATQESCSSADTQSTGTSSISLESPTQLSLTQPDPLSENGNTASTPQPSSEPISQLKREKPRQANAGSSVIDRKENLGLPEEGSKNSLVTDFVPITDILSVTDFSSATDTSSAIDLSSTQTPSEKASVSQLPLPSTPSIAQAFSESSASQSLLPTHPTIGSAEPITKAETTATDEIASFETESVNQLTFKPSNHHSSSQSSAPPIAQTFAEPSTDQSFEPNSTVESVEPELSNEWETVEESAVVDAESISQLSSQSSDGNFSLLPSTPSIAQALSEQALSESSTSQSFEPKDSAVELTESALDNELVTKETDSFTSEPVGETSNVEPFSQPATFSTAQASAESSIPQIVEPAALTVEFTESTKLLPDNETSSLTQASSVSSTFQPLEPTNSTIESTESGLNNEPALAEEVNSTTPKPISESNSEFSQQPLISSPAQASTKSFIPQAIEHTVSTVESTDSIESALGDKWKPLEEAALTAAGPADLIAPHASRSNLSAQPTTPSIAQTFAEPSSPQSFEPTTSTKKSTGSLSDSQSTVTEMVYSVTSESTGEASNSEFSPQLSTPSIAQASAELPSSQPLGPTNSTEESTESILSNNENPTEVASIAAKSVDHIAPQLANISSSSQPTTPPIAQAFSESFVSQPLEPTNLTVESTELLLDNESGLTEDANAFESESTASPTSQSASVVPAELKSPEPILANNAAIAESDLSSAKSISPDPAQLLNTNDTTQASGSPVAQASAESVISTESLESVSSAESLATTLANSEISTEESAVSSSAPASTVSSQTSNIRTESARTSNSSSTVQSSQAAIFPRKGYAIAQASTKSTATSELSESSDSLASKPSNSSYTIQPSAPFVAQASAGLPTSQTSDFSSSESVSSSSASASEAALPKKASSPKMPIPPSFDSASSILVSHESALTRETTPQSAPPSVESAPSVAQASTQLVPPQSNDSALSSTEKLENNPSNSLPENNTDFSTEQAAYGFIQKKTATTKIPSSISSADSSLADSPVSIAQSPRPAVEKSETFPNSSPHQTTDASVQNSIVNSLQRQSDQTALDQPTLDQTIEDGQKAPPTVQLKSSVSDSLPNSPTDIQSAAENVSNASHSSVQPKITSAQENNISLIKPSADTATASTQILKPSKSPLAASPNTNANHITSKLSAPTIHSLQKAEQIPTIRASKNISFSAENTQTAPTQDSSYKPSTAEDTTVDSTSPTPSIQKSAHLPAFLKTEVATPLIKTNKENNSAEADLSPTVSQPQLEGAVNLAIQRKPNTLSPTPPVADQLQPNRAQYKEHSSNTTVASEMAIDLPSSSQPSNSIREIPVSIDSLSTAESTAAPRQLKSISTPEISAVGSPSALTQLPPQTVPTARTPLTTPELEPLSANPQTAQPQLIAQPQIAQKEPLGHHEPLEGNTRAPSSLAGFDATSIQKTGAVRTTSGMSIAPKLTASTATNSVTQAKALSSNSPFSNERYSKPLPAPAQASAGPNESSDTAPARGQTPESWNSLEELMSTSQAPSRAPVAPQRSASAVQLSTSLPNHPALPTPVPCIQAAAVQPIPLIQLHPDPNSEPTQAKRAPANSKKHMFDTSPGEMNHVEGKMTGIVADTVRETLEEQKNSRRKLHNMEFLAREIYGLLRQRLEIEKERHHNSYHGNLPW